MEASKTTVDFEQLLAPISEVRPSGINIREDESPTSPYYQLKDARNTARADERNQAAVPEAERQESQHWNTILDLAPRILAEQSKDLEVAAWYTEALVRKYGLVGLRDGLTLLDRMVSDFWDDLYPQEDDDGIETKIAPLSGLFGLTSAGSLAQAINQIVITDPSKQPRYEVWQYQQALSLLRAPDAKTRNKRIESGVPTLENLEKAAKQTDNAFYQTLIIDLNDSQEAFDKLFERLDDLAKNSAPNAASVRNALKSTHAAITALTKHLSGNLSLESAEVTDDTVMNANVGASSTSVGNIKKRSEAFATIETIAEFFHTTEPHSPISYALKRIVKWGDMELPELLQELVTDKMAYEAYCKLTGIEVPKPPMQTQPMPQQMEYNDPMYPSNPMGGGGYPPPMHGESMGDPMFNNTF